MAMQILGKSPELTLIFDRSALWLSSSQLKLLGETLRAVEGVESVQTHTVWYRKPQIRVVFNPDTEPNAILRKMAFALRLPQNQSPSCNEQVSGPLRSLTQHSGSSRSSFSDDLSTPECSSAEAHAGRDELLNGYPRVRNRLHEAAYGVLAMGSFVMSWVGLIVPGIPTVPFVLLTAHFALQASPALRERLLKSRTFGPMIRDWQQYRAIHRIVQIEAYIFTIVIIFVGLLFSPPIPILYVGMGIASAMGLYAISQIPVIGSSEKERSTIRVNGYLMQPIVVVSD